MTSESHYGSPRLLRKSLVALGIVSGFFLLALATVAFMGSRLDSSYTIAAEGVLELNFVDSWAMITDRDLAPLWNESIEEVKLLSRDSDGDLWQETYANGAAQTFRMQLFPEKKQISRQIEQEDSPFSSRWQIQLDPLDAKNTRIVITETASIENPFVRFITYHIVGKDAFVRTYLSHLQNYQSQFLNLKATTAQP